MRQVMLKYRGSFIALAGKEEEPLTVPEDVVEAKDRIIEMVQETYGIKPPMVLMIDSVHIAKILKNPGNYPVKEGSEIVLLPVISGG